MFDDILNVCVTSISAVCVGFVSCRLRQPSTSFNTFSYLSYHFICSDLAVRASLHMTRNTIVDCNVKYPEHCLHVFTVMPKLTQPYAVHWMAKHACVHVCMRACMSVCLSLCLTGKCTVAKQLIGSGCHLGWWVGQSRDGCIRWGWWKSGRSCFGGEFETSHCNQWWLCCIVVWEWCAVPKWLWGGVFIVII